MTDRLKEINERLRMIHEHLDYWANSPGGIWTGEWRHINAERIALERERQSLLNPPYPLRQL